MELMWSDRMYRYYKLGLQFLIVQIDKENI